MWLQQTLTFMKGTGPESVFPTLKPEGEVAVGVSDQHLKENAFISELSGLWKKRGSKYYCCHYFLF